MNARVLCVLPCYNEAVNLPELFADLRAERIEKDFNLLFIDDCSTDQTAELLLASGHRTIRHEENRGYGQTIRTGFEVALQESYDYIALFPGDGQRRAADLKHLLHVCLREDFDAVSGSKFHLYREHGSPFTRQLGNLIFSQLARRAWDSPIEDVLSGFKVYRVEAIRPFLDVLPRGYGFDICFSLYASRFKLRIKEVSVACRYDENTSKMRNIVAVSLRMLGQVAYHFCAQPLLLPTSSRLKPPERKVG